jgi:hypothetical protein
MSSSLELENMAALAAAEEDLAEAMAAAEEAHAEAKAEDDRVEAGTDRVDVLINRAFGGFSISDEARDAYNAQKGPPALKPHSTEARTDPLLVRIYRDIGSQRFSGGISQVECESISRACWTYGYWQIDEYDGVESVVDDDARAMARWRAERVKAKVADLLDRGIELSAFTRDDLKDVRAALDVL